MPPQEARYNNFFGGLVQCTYNSRVNFPDQRLLVQGETESFRLIPSLIQSHTKPHTKTVREKVILAKEGISLKDNSVSPCIYNKLYHNIRIIQDLVKLFFSRYVAHTYMFH